MSDERVAVRKSKIDGLGLFAVKRLAARRKIGELTGERISEAQARRLARQHKRIAIVELGDGTAINAHASPEPYRYINHSCVPNTYIRICYGHVEFYALRTIKPGEELTANYGETHHDGKLACRCGQPGCKGFL